MRKKSRYFLVKVISEGLISEDSLRNSIVSSIQDLYGDLGLAEAETHLIEYNEKTSSGIIKCSRNSTNKVRAAIAMISRIREEPSCIYIHAVSGTSKKFKEKKDRFPDS
jgi:ribonuclease P/MRP protein subunit POP5